MDDERELTDITVEELLIRYANGERDFSYVAIDDGVECLLRGVDLSSINLEGSYLAVDFSGSILRKANFRYTMWDIAIWEDIDFSSSDFTGINNGDASYFVRCNFSNTIWEQADLFQCTFEDCNLTGATFGDARFAEVEFT